MYKRSLIGHKGSIICMDVSGTKLIPQANVASSSSGDVESDNSNNNSSSSGNNSTSELTTVFSPSESVSESHKASLNQAQSSGGGAAESQGMASFGLVATGSEDKTVRLWDLRSRGGAVKCIANVFGSAVESVSFNPLNSNVLYAISNTSIFTFDIRMDATLIVKEARSSLFMSASSKLTEEDDEINCMSIHHRGNCLFASHDSGDISIVPINTSTCEPVLSAQGLQKKKATGGHTALVSALQARPKNSWEFASGGFDCKVTLWDINKGRSIRSKTFPSLTSYNPPFVQALGFHNSGKYLCVGLGSGQISMLTMPELDSEVAVEAHNGMVSSLQVVDDFVISGGVDKKIRFFKMRSDNSSVSPSSISGSNSKSSKSKNNKGKSKQSSETSGDARFSNLESLGFINHASKINVIQALWSNQDVEGVKQKFSDGLPSTESTQASNELTAETMNKDFEFDGLFAPICVGDTTNNASIYYFKS